MVLLFLKINKSEVCSSSWSPGQAADKSSVPLRRVLKRDWVMFCWQNRDQERPRCAKYALARRNRFRRERAASEIVALGLTPPISNQ